MTTEVSRRSGRGPFAALAAVVTLVLLACALTPQMAPAEVTGALFQSRPTVPDSTFSSQKLFSRERVGVASYLRDYTGANVETHPDPFGAADSFYFRTTNWPTGYTTGRYVDVDLHSPLPAGLALTGATVNLTVGAEAPDCFYFYTELRRASTDAYLGRSPEHYVCATSGIYFMSFAFDATAHLTTTDAANDVRVRIVGRNTNGFEAYIDRLNLTGSVVLDGVSTAVAVHRRLRNDQADGTADKSGWYLSAEGDATVGAGHYATTAAWPTSLNKNYWIEPTITYPSTAVIPSNSVVTGASLTNTWRASNTSASMCYQYDVIDSAGATLFSSTTATCKAAGSAYQKDVLSLPSIDTPAKAKGVRIRMYYYVTNGLTGVGTLHDYVALGVTYGLA